MKRPAGLLLVLLVACRTASPTAPAAPLAPAAAPSPTPSAAPTMPDSLHWFRNSAEYRALTLQTYRLAAQTLERRVSGKARNAWAVILDADETVLDNSQYFKERSVLGQKFSRPTWHEWTQRKTAGSVPGAADFLKRVQELGGRIAIVTNRAASECPDTEVNFKANGLPFDVILCNADLGNSSKQGRFEQVAKGATPAGLPPLDVVMWMGDNVLDFPGMNQDARLRPERLKEFGERFFVLPNPTYGSWEGSPRQ